MSAQTKGKLRSYGIAPPQGLALGKRELLSQKSIICPLCSSDNTEQISHFGSTACKALYKCKVCMEPFDYFKCF
jgi:ring-1,2-phenylacetyl-CoA epoxidase subunit PaaD